MLPTKNTGNASINRPLSGLFSQKPEPNQSSAILTQTEKWQESLLRSVFTLPIRYADRRSLMDTPDFEEDLKVYVQGTIIHQKVIQSKKGAFLDVEAKDTLGHTFHVLWFNFRAYQEKILQPGNVHIFSGKPKKRQHQWTLFNPEILTDAAMGSIEPIYRKEGKEQSEQIKKRIRLLLKESAQFIPGLFPDNLDTILGVLDLPPLMTALRDAHWPHDLEAAYRAQESIKVAEMVVHMNAMSHPAHSRTTAIRPALSVSPEQNARLLQTLPFALSPSQTQAWTGMRACLATARAQDILILGGVGSGKSALAFLAAMAQATAPSIPNRALLIAPTVILAQQLYENLLGIAASLGLDVGLYGRDNYAQGTMAHARLWVGTYGLLAAVNDWTQVGLVVMDEEHRYGKETKDLPPHVHRVLMSATPIPNTLAQQRFGAMHQFRVLNDHHQREVQSFVIPRHEPKPALEQLHKTLLRQRKGLVVYAAVQERSAITLPAHSYFLHPQIQGDKVIPIEAQKVHPDLTPDAPMDSQKLGKMLLPYSETLVRQNPQVLTPFYRLNKDFSAKKLLESETQLDLLAEDILLYDKDQPDRLFMAPVSWLRRGKSGAMSTKTILAACQQDALESMPLIRGSQLLQGKSLESARTFWEERFPGQTVFLHGKMSDTEKSSALDRFRSGSTPLLIASNIVEVGIDVPGAETVIVADADRMGVASLAQIRGRVGRHGEKGYCYFLGSARDQEGMDRLQRIAREDNDEQLAIQDFMERGFGSGNQQAQSGNTARLFRLPRDARLFLKVAQIRNRLNDAHGKTSPAPLAG